MKPCSVLFYIPALHFLCTDWLFHQNSNGLQDLYAKCFLDNMMTEWGTFLHKYHNLAWCGWIFFYVAQTKLCSPLSVAWEVVVKSDAQMHFNFFWIDFQRGDYGTVGPTVRTRRFWLQGVWGAAFVGGEFHHTSRCIIRTEYEWFCSLETISCLRWVLFFLLKRNIFDQEHSWRRCTTYDWSGQTCWTSVSTGATVVAEQSWGGCRRPFRSTPPHSVGWCFWWTTESTPTAASREVRRHFSDSQSCIYVPLVVYWPLNVLHSFRLCDRGKGVHRLPFPLPGGTAGGGAAGGALCQSSAEQQAKRAAWWEV